MHNEGGTLQATESRLAPMTLALTLACALLGQPRSHSPFHPQPLPGGDVSSRGSSCRFPTSITSCGTSCPRWAWFP